MQSSVFLSLFCGIVLIGCSVCQPASKAFSKSTQTRFLPTCQQPKRNPGFLVISGGGAPSYNEIAIEKNVLYFQRTLQTLGFDPAQASIFFANGTDGRATIRYLDSQKRERFKAPEIPHLAGAATLPNIRRWFDQFAQREESSSQQPLFFYFTGHGERNPKNLNNNTLILWQEKHLTVQDFTRLLDRLPQQKPVIALMVQCYSGSFANLIYEGGNPARPLALQTRCGFFATVKQLPSVGCTPEVNEADYRDYSSSFFAGLSGRSRTGGTVASADYNRDGRISFAEAHAFAKIDEQSPDLPVSTSEAWLQEQVTEAEAEQILGKPIVQLSQVARPEQVAVVTALSQRFRFNLGQSFKQNLDRLGDVRTRPEEDQAYLIRLSMELINISQEQRVRESKNPRLLKILDRLINCEASGLQS